MTAIQQQIVHALCYYEVFSHPLTAREIFLFLPRQLVSFPELRRHLEGAVSAQRIRRWGDYYFLPHHQRSVVLRRLSKARIARRRWIIARFMAHIMKRFPFVRAIFISGDLAKDATYSQSDIDYVIVTAPRRLWLCRSLLILFKKILLLNRKKYFCLNYWVSTDQLLTEDRNDFTATEIAHLKPLYNLPLYLTYMNVNGWIKDYFPNYLIFLNGMRTCNNRRSVLQRLLELPFHGGWVDKLDVWLMKKMEAVWKRRYPHLDESDLDFRFRCRPGESRAFGQEFSTPVLASYRLNLQRHIVRGTENLV